MMGRRQSRSPMVIKEKDNHKMIEFLSIGSTVEVGSDKEWFKGAWYVAKILKSNYKRKGKFLIQYQTLVSDKDPDELLTESVDIPFIRPLPPPPAADQTYEVHDVVDAFHRHGWWKGVVSKVEVLEKEKGKSIKYSVVFENPPEKLELCSENLRFHFVWTDGKWVQPPKQKRMEGLKIGKGMDVEVNFDRENLQDAWFPAIVVEEVGFNSFLVECVRSGNDGKDGQMKETIDSFHIRPPPPKLEVQNFEILECVEALCDSCWKKGTVVKSLTQGRYSVLLGSEKEEIHVRKSEIRPHLLWTNGKWIGFREILNTTQCEEQSAHVDNIAKHSEVVAPITSSSDAKNHNEETSSCKRMSDGMAHSKDKSCVKKWRNDPLDIQKESEQENVSKGTASEMKFEDRASKEAEFSFRMENADAMVRTSSILSVGDHTAKVGGSCDSVNGDQALSTCFRSDKDRHGENSNQSPAIIVESDSELVEKRELPFTKSSPLWKHVDSLEVFQFMPQKPHFRPLLELNEATREGFAIGHMLNFSILVGKTSNLQADVPRKVFESCLEALADLEFLGFDIKAVVDRINKLLGIKTRQEQLNNESEDIHSKIAQCDAEKAEIEEEINAIDKMKGALETIRAMKLSEKVMKDSDINLLQLDASRISEDISNMELDFKSQVAAPW